MLKETTKDRVDNNRCFICDVEFTDNYLKITMDYDPLLINEISIKRI